MDDNTKKNIFTRVLIVILIIFILILISFNFFYYSEPTGTFSKGSLILIGFLTILVLTEVFDNLTLGKFISLKRNYNEKKAELFDEKAENKELRNHIITIATSINQSQSNTNIIGGNSDNLMDKLISYVIKANKDEIKQKEQEENETSEKEESNTARKRLDYAKIENDAINKYLGANNISSNKILKEVKLAHQIKGLDPVSTSDFIYDAYIEDTETFIEVKSNRTLTLLFRDRLYSMLTKILYYRSAKKVEATLVLIIANIPEEGRSCRANFVNRINTEFEPAINKGLLKIDYFNITEEELTEYYRE